MNKSYRTEEPEHGGGKAERGLKNEQGRPPAALLGAGGEMTAPEKNARRRVLESNLNFSSENAFQSRKGFILRVVQFCPRFP